MPAVYRVDISPNNRAGCQNSECKKAAIKILKGETRFATQVEIQEHTSWQYKHWGCVTPANCATWKEISDEGDPEMVDGLDELPEEIQQKVLRAIKQGHVDDEDWRGDVEKNRPGEKGFRLTKADRKRLGLEEPEDGDEDAAPAKKAANGKRSKKDADAAEEDEAPPAKKSKTGAKKASKAAAKKHEDSEDDDDDDDDDEAEAALEKESGDEEAAPTPKAKKPRGRPKKAVAEAPAEDAANHDDAPAPKRGRGRPKKAVAAPAAEAAAADGSGAAPKKGRGRPKKIAATNDEVAQEAPKKRGRGRPKKTVETVGEE